MGIKGDILGKDLLKALEKFPVNFQKRVFNGAIRAGAAPIRDEARRLVPLETGNLEKSITIVKRRQLRLNKNLVTFSVTPIKKQGFYKTFAVDSENNKGSGRRKQYRAAKSQGEIGGWYAHFLEFGTEKMIAQPFLRPAFNLKYKDSIGASKAYIQKRMKKEVARAKR